MATKTISIKELRQNLPKIRQEMEKGISFILIHRSKPIGELRPWSRVDKEALRKTLQFWADPPQKFHLKSKKSAVEIIREDRDGLLQTHGIAHH